MIDGSELKYIPLPHWTPGGLGLSLQPKGYKQIWNTIYQVWERERLVG